MVEKALPTISFITLRQNQFNATGSGIENARRTDRLSRAKAHPLFVSIPDFVQQEDVAVFPQGLQSKRNISVLQLQNPA